MGVPVLYTESQWELVDDTFYCTHPDIRVEDVEVDTMVNGEHSTYISNVAICEDCGQEIEDFDWRAYHDDDREFEED